MRNRLVLLPTFEIVRDTIAYDPVFYFMPKGIRSVILEAVFSKSFNYRHVYQEFPSKIPFKTGLVGQILSQYDDHMVRTDNLEVDILEDGRLVRNRPPTYLEQMQAIELVVSEVEQRVTEMLRSVLATEYFDVSERYTQWKENDLIVDLFELSEHDVRSHVHDPDVHVFRKLF